MRCSTKGGSFVEFVIVFLTFACVQCASPTTVLFSPISSTNDNRVTTKTKRQLYREQLLPQKGGKIPESAFQVDRLAANRLNKEGISIPDGVLLEQRNRESHYREHRHDPDIERHIIRLKQTPDGRYTAAEGRYPVFENEIHSTYIIRPPIVENRIVPLAPTPAPPHPPFSPNLAAASSLQIPSDQMRYELIAASSNADKNSALASFNRLAHNGFGNTLWWHQQSQQPQQWSTPSWVYQELFDQTLGYETSRNKGYIADFPSLTHIPFTSFVCDNSGKMYADPEAKCQAFHLCHYNGNKETFLCPPGTRFDSIRSECSPWYKTECVRTT